MDIAHHLPPMPFGVSLPLRIYSRVIPPAYWTFVYATCTFAASPSASIQVISNPWDLGPIVIRLANRLTSLRIKAQEAL